MYAQLGNIIFEGLKGFTSYQSKRATKYAEHALFGGKPRLQLVGQELDTVTFDMQFHAAFCDPDTEIAALDSARVNSEVLPLLTGAGELLGTFVIESIEETTIQTDKRGSTVLAVLNVQLKEFVEPNELGAQDAAFKSAGFGNAANSPLKVPFKPNAQGEAAAIMKTANSVRTQASAVSGTLAKAKAIASQANHYATKAQSALKTMRKNLDTMNTQITNAKNVYNSAIRIKNGIATTQVALDSTLSQLEAGNIDGAIGANNSLQSAVTGTMSSSSEIASLTAVKRK